jgi:hypothetical protein
MSYTNFPNSCKRYQDIKGRDELFDIEFKIYITEENLAMLSENNFDYVCVSRSKLKDCRIDPACCPVEIATLHQTKICSAQIGI